MRNKLYIGLLIAIWIGYSGYYYQDNIMNLFIQSGYIENEFDDVNTDIAISDGYDSLVNQYREGDQLIGGINNISNGRNSVIVGTSHSISSNNNNHIIESYDCIVEGNYNILYNCKKVEVKGDKNLISECTNMKIEGLPTQGISLQDVHNRRYWYEGGEWKYEEI